MDAFDADRRSLPPKTDFSRCEMIAATGLATGFALAVQPIAGMTARATGKVPPRTAGSACWPGSRRTGPHEARSVPDPPS
jgi:hypothetical protein